MPTPMAICIENVDPRADQPQYVRCVAVPGRQPGLRVNGAGELLWRCEDGVACELWVSADEQLILYRPQGAEPVIVRRSGRSLEVPFGNPVVMIDKDEFQVGARRLRMHVHGAAPQVAAPSVFDPERGALERLARAAATAAVIGAVAASTGCSDKIEVREKPPSVMVNPPPPTNPLPPTNLPIEVRERPPDMEIRNPALKAEPPKKIEVRETPPEIAL